MGSISKQRTALNQKKRLLQVSLIESSQRPSSVALVLILHEEQATYESTWKSVSLYIVLPETENNTVSIGIGMGN